MSAFTDFVESFMPTPHTVVCEAWQDLDDDEGDRYAAGVTVSPCYVDRARRSMDVGGTTQVVSTATVFADEGVVFPPRSRVTLSDGTTTTVIVTEVFDDGGNGLPSHVEIACE